MKVAHIFIFGGSFPAALLELVVAVASAGNICGMNWEASAKRLKAGTKKDKFTERG